MAKQQYTSSTFSTPECSSQSSPKYVARTRLNTRNNQRTFLKLLKSHKSTFQNELWQKIKPFFLRKRIDKAPIIRPSARTIKSSLKPTPRDINIEGHRGAPFLCLENTISSFQKAQEQKANSVEMDTWLTKDEIVVVVHGSLEGEIVNYGKKTFLHDLNFDDIDPELHIPKLADVFNALRQKIKFNIELKGKDLNLVRKIVDNIKKSKIRISDICLSSFNFEFYNQLKKLIDQGYCPIIFFKYLVEKPEEININDIKDWRHKGINMDVNSVFTEQGMKLIDQANKKHIPLSVYMPMAYIETKELVCLLKDLGISTIICNTISSVFHFNEWAK